MSKLKGIKIGYALTGSFCTFEKSFKQAMILRDMGAELIPIMSENASSISTRFGTSENNIQTIENICGRPAILTIDKAEPIGPKDLTDLLIVAPCTSNTANKLAMSITDTTVTMAVKSHLRKGKPVFPLCCSGGCDRLNGIKRGERRGRKKGETGLVQAG